jgi:hypothetical protein
VHAERATGASEGPQDQSVRLALTCAAWWRYAIGRGGASGHVRPDTSDHAGSSLDSDRAGSSLDSDRALARQDSALFGEVKRLFSTAPEVRKETEANGGHCGDRTLHRMRSRFDRTRPVTPQVFSSIIVLHLHGISIRMHHSCLLFYVMQHMCLY